MKKLLLLALLAGCTSKPAEDPTHTAISALLQKSMDDPASYQPARWGKHELWTVGDSISAKAGLLKGLLQSRGLGIASDSAIIGRYSKLSYAQQYIVGPKAELPRLRHERDSLRTALAHLPAPTDTTRLGYYMMHAFRAKNKLGALVLDSVEFYVNNKGKVTQPIK